MSADWELLRREVAFQGYFRIDRFHLRHRRFDGSWTPVLQRELFERGHAVAVLPWDPQLDRVLLIEQFRVGALDAPAGPWLLELVAGIIEPEETVEAVARREAGEEAGIVITDLERVCEYLVSPGGTSERTTLFIGRADLRAAGGIHGCADENEDIRVHTFSTEEAIELADHERANNAAAMIALNWFARHQDRLRRQWCD
jgi:ADP-ribose pyrophosphatase